MKLVAVTACPTGIAHSQMAAENLERVATAEGHAIDVEVQGAMGRENELSSEAIAAADAVIIAAATSVSRDRFEDKPLVEGTVKEAVADAEGLIDRAIAEADGEGLAANDGENGAGGADVADPIGVAASRDGGDRTSRLVDRLKRLFY